MTLNRNRQFLILGVAVIAGIFAIITFSSKGEGTSKHTKKNTPEMALEKFYNAMKSGDFDSAASLCDTTSMQDYMSTYMQQWADMSQKDSAEFAAIVSTLANTTLSIKEVNHEDGVCFINYTLSMDGVTKQCKATAKKEKGEWKVATITNEI